MTIDSAYRRVRKAAKAATRPPTIAEATATKRCTESARAPSDFATPRRPLAQPRCADRAKTIQTLLGDHQDSVVSRTHLSQQAEAAHAAGEDTFTYGLLYQQEDDLAQRSREQLDAALKKLDKVGPQVLTRTRTRRAGGRTSWPVSRILSLAAAKPRRRGGDHPSGHSVTGCLERPTRRLGRAALERLRSRTRRGLLGLASGGVCLASPVTRDAGALLPHRFTLTTPPKGRWRFAFCGTFPRVTSDCR